MFRLSSEPIENWKGTVAPSSGAVVTFDGHVRDHNEGKRVLSLSYEAFNELAESEGKLVLEEARQRFALVSAQCAHRTGALKIGDVAVRVECQSSHRGAAFEACEWVIDEVKRRVPIWKKEFYEDGESAWINAASGALERQAK